MSTTSQKRAIRNYRDRLNERGMARFEVVGLDADRALVRTFARRLARGGQEAARLRAVVHRTITGDQPRSGGILEALRRSPLVGIDFQTARAREPGRKVDL